MAKGEHKGAAHLARQPFGQIPALEDTENGVQMFESRAIARYIAEKYKDQGTDLLVLKDIKKKATVETWMSVEQANFDAWASRIVWELILKKFRGLETDPAAVELAKTKLIDSLNVYEAQLSTRQYVAGDSYTLADLFHIPYGSKLFAAGHGDLITSRPHVKAWFERITARDSWTAVKPQ
ncbi:hypothetical protein HDU76_010418 [Blyttiomyces sp. JEL0837]|nr:hypothetical protein HDU76_010418 [Blyttiomyces sp. JEL0837]